MTLTSTFWIKNGLKVRFLDFSTRKDLRLVHQDYFKHTARPRKNGSEVDTHQLELSDGLSGTAQTDPQEKNP